jgi:hypothetical protein
MQMITYDLTYNINTILQEAKFAPVRAPADMSTFPALIALMLEDRSGAPFPRATKVTTGSSGK